MLPYLPVDRLGVPVSRDHKANCLTGAAVGSGWRLSRDVVSPPQA